MQGNGVVGIHYEHLFLHFSIYFAASAASSSLILPLLALPHMGIALCLVKTFWTLGLLPKWPATRQNYKPMTIYGTTNTPDVFKSQDCQVRFFRK
jgi:hypothetical protein